MDLMFQGPHTRSGRRNAMDGLISGNTYTYNLGSYDEILGFVDKLSTNPEEHVVLISRTPQNQLYTHVDIEKVETYWITNQIVKGSIMPSIEKVEEIILSRISNHKGTIIVEGIELLYSSNEYSEILNMSMRIKDNLHRRPWSVIFVFADQIFDEIQRAKWYRESPDWKVPVEQLIDMDDFEALATTELSEIDEFEPDESESHRSLAMLTRLPREGYTKEIARKRILLWRRMGLEVSGAEPALYQLDDDKSFATYKKVENKVRKAIELDNRLDLLEERGHGTKITKMRFRVRQLTGLSEVEKEIDEII